MAIAVHPYVSGVPHRIKYFEAIYEYMRHNPGVLFWTGEQILDWYKG
jgi:allantoinase